MTFNIKNKLLVSILAIALYPNAYADDIVKKANQAVLEASMMAVMAEQASPWLLIAKSEGSSYFLNGESIELVKQPYTAEITKYGQPMFFDSYVKSWWKELNDDGSETKYLSISYCGKGYYKTIDGARYDSNLELEYKVQPNLYVKAVIPETVMSLVYKHSCDLRF